MFNKDVHSQVEYLGKILRKNKAIAEILEKAPVLGLPNWYLGTGAIANTIWNELSGYPLEHGIKDCDVVYFDTDTSSAAQDTYISKGEELFSALHLKIEITNEARVHLWYKQEFGKSIEPYKSTENAINTWPTTATAVGVRYENERFIVYAPYGLNDLMGMIIRPNKELITQDVYEKKVERWHTERPKLNVIPWSR